MFEEIVLVLFVVSFLLALRASRKFMEKPSVKDVKKSLDKHRVIFRGHSSSK